MRMLATVGLLAALAFAPAAMAGSLIVLQSDVSSGASVTLGDLFDGVGSQASVVIGNGAPFGQSAVLDANAVRRIAGQHGLDWDNPDAITRIIVARGGARASGAHMTDTLTWTRSIQSGDVICQFAPNVGPPFAPNISPLTPAFAVARRRSAKPLA